MSIRSLGSVDMDSTVNCPVADSGRLISNEADDRIVFIPSNIHFQLTELHREHRLLG